MANEAIELLTAEMAKASEEEKKIGEYLLSVFPDKTNGLEKAWAEKGFTLGKLFALLMKKAEKEANKSRSLCVTGETVFGWVNHIVMDEEPEKEKKPSTKTAEADDGEEDGSESEEEPKAAKAVPAKPKEEEKHGFEQISLFMS